MLNFNKMNRPLFQGTRNVPNGAIGTTRHPSAAKLMGPSYGRPFVPKVGKSQFQQTLDTQGRHNGVPHT